MFYHQTVKPLVDDKKLKEQIAHLQIQTGNLISTNELLSQEKLNIERSLESLNLRRETLEEDLQNKEKKLLNLKDEVITANAYAIMSPIISNLMYSHTFNSGVEHENVRDETLKELNNKLNDNISETQRETIDILKEYVDEKIDDYSFYSDLFGYRVYI